MIAFKPLVFLPDKTVDRFYERLGLLARDRGCGACRDWVVPATCEEIKEKISEARIRLDDGDAEDKRIDRALDKFEARRLKRKESSRRKRAAAEGRAMPVSLFFSVQLRAQSDWIHLLSLISLVVLPVYTGLDHTGSYQAQRRLIHVL